MTMKTRRLSPILGRPSRPVIWALAVITAGLSAYAPACSCEPGGYGGGGSFGGGGGGGFVEGGVGGFGGGGGFGGEPCPPAEDAGAPDTGGPATWSRAFTGLELAQAGGVAATPGGGVIVSGTFSGILNAGGELAAKNASDLFVVALDAAGSRVWSRAFAVSGQGTAGPIAVDAAGNVVVSAAFSGVLDYGTGTLTGGLDASLALLGLDPDGNVLWSQAHGVNAFPTALALDAAANIFVTAQTGATGTLAKYDPTGNHLWSDHLDGPIGFLALDPTGDVVVAEGALGAPTLVRKLDPAGVSLWARSSPAATATDGFLVAGVAIAPTGTIAVAGSLMGSVDFGGGLLAAVHAGDAAVFTLDADGAWLSSQSFPDAGLPLATDAMGGAEASAVGFTPGGGMFLATVSSAVDLQGTVTLPAGVGVLQLAADGSVVRDHTSATWLADTGSFGTGPARVSLAVDAQGGAVALWTTHQMPCPPVLDFGNGALPPNDRVVIVRFPP
jgi:hypothetical protein